MSTLKPVPIPTGGAVGITFTTAISGDITLSRAPFGDTGLGPWTIIYNGPPLNDKGINQFVLDLGNDISIPGPLLSTSQYVYQLTDSTGTIQSDPLTPVYSIDLDRIDFSKIMIGLLQGSINSAALPAGINRARAMHVMPLNGLPPMPFVVINPELVQQEEVPIGQDIPNPIATEDLTKTIWTRTEFANHVFRVSIFSLNAEERDYYRDLVLATFKISLGYVFAELGLDITHRYQANSFQLQRPTEGMVPGFYGCDVMLEFIGTTNVSVVTTYGIGLISEIDTWVFAPPEPPQIIDETISR